MKNRISIAKAVSEAITARQEESHWEDFIMAILRRLQLSPAELQQATEAYEDLAKKLCVKLGIAENDIHIVVQGSMRTETTIAQPGNRKFDLDIVVKLCGSLFATLGPERFFEVFGDALRELKGEEGEPSPRRRCWRLPYPNLPFYFDVTPAIPGSEIITGTHLRVRDPMTGWSPSNPEEFADWFIEAAALRFAFHEEQRRKLAEARAEVDPLPDQKVAIDDILRRLVQIMKLHRDNYYWSASEARKEAMPISVILVTLAGHAYRKVWSERRHSATSAIEVVLATIEAMPDFIDKEDKYRVPNPKFTSENFADKWNTDGGLRASEFEKWHGELLDDLETMFLEHYDGRSEPRIQRVFGEAGVKAWRDFARRPGILEGLIATAPATSRANPTRPVPTGARNTLA